MSDTDEVSKPVLEGVIERGPRGRFVKGNPGPPEGKKRKKGQLNKIHRTVKECMTGAAARYGSDGKGKGGMDGFWDFVAQKSPVFLAAAVAKTCVPPPAREGELTPEGGYSINAVNIISIPHDHSVCPDGCTRPNFEAETLWEAEHVRRAAEEARRQAEAMSPLRLIHSAVIGQEMVEVEPESELQVPSIKPEPAPEPAPALDPVMERAMAMGYVPLPPRQCRID